MSSLISVFILKLIRLNYGEPCSIKETTMDHYPTEAEMLEYLERCNWLDEVSRNFETILKVEKIYRVLPSETKQPTEFPGWNQIVYPVKPEDLYVKSDPSRTFVPDAQREGKLNFPFPEGPGFMRVQSEIVEWAESVKFPSEYNKDFQILWNRLAVLWLQ